MTYIKIAWLQHHDWASHHTIPNTLYYKLNFLNQCLRLPSFLLIFPYYITTGIINLVCDYILHDGHNNTTYILPVYANMYSGSLQLSVSNWNQLICTTFICNLISQWMSFYAFGSWRHLFLICVHDNLSMRTQTNTGIIPHTCCSARPLHAARGIGTKMRFDVLLLIRGLLGGGLPFVSWRQSDGDCKLLHAIFAPW